MLVLTQTLEMTKCIDILFLDVLLYSVPTLLLQQWYVKFMSIIIIFGGTLNIVSFKILICVKSNFLALTCWSSVSSNMLTMWQDVSA